MLAFPGNLAKENLNRSKLCGEDENCSGGYFYESICHSDRGIAEWRNLAANEKQFHRNPDVSTEPVLNEAERARHDKRIKVCSAHATGFIAVALVRLIQSDFSRRFCADFGV